MRLGILDILKKLVWLVSLLYEILLRTRGELYLPISGFKPIAAKNVDKTSLHCLQQYL